MYIVRQLKFFQAGQREGIQIIDLNSFFLHDGSRCPVIRDGVNVVASGAIPDAIGYRGGGGPDQRGAGEL